MTAIGLVVAMTMAAPSMLEVKGTLLVNGQSGQILCAGFRRVALRFEGPGTSTLLPVECGPNPTFSGTLAPGLYDVDLERSNDPFSPPMVEAAADRFAVNKTQVTVNLSRSVVSGVLHLLGAARSQYEERANTVPPRLLFTAKNGNSRAVGLDNRTPEPSFLVDLPPGTYEVRVDSVFAPYSWLLVPAAVVKPGANQRLDLSLTARNVHFTLTVNHHAPLNVLTVVGANAEGQAMLVSRDGTQFLEKLGGAPDPFSFNLILPDGVYHPIVDVRPAVARPVPANPDELDLRHEPDLYWSWLEGLSLPDIRVTHDGEVTLNLAVASLTGQVPVKDCDKRHGLTVTLSTVNSPVARSFTAPSWCHDDQLSYDAVVPPGTYQVVLSHTEPSYTGQHELHSVVLSDRQKTAPLP